MIIFLVVFFFFFFKQKTAYEMRISDWSSDVCSSDLRSFPRRYAAGRRSGCRGTCPACGCSRRQTLGRLCPLLAVGPGPDVCSLEGGHRLRAVGIAAAPRVHRLCVREPEPTSDLGGYAEGSHVPPPSHGSARSSRTYR